MDDWENEDFDNVKLPGVKNRWDDEDVDSEEDIKESWDDSEDEKPKPSPKPKESPKVNPKQKTTKKLTKAQQRKAEEEKRMREKEEREELENETIDQRKLREAKLVQESDFQNALDLFGADAAIPRNKDDDEDYSDDDVENEKEKKVFIEELKPKTKEDFKKYAETVYEEISRYDKNQFYNYLLETLLKNVSEPMEIANVRKLINTLQLQITNKQKAQAKKKKTPKKASIKQAYDDDIISDGMKFKYDDGADDYDFM
ncbi:translation initiation factor eIF3 subunit [Anaeromyces robustus]|jgi:translation initiation factor 3 subunit J|uniref:Eukaryotic translation initiation factor 3 30 kDa subunit n=1 Tax=Anaeromyces robustus TaxID=1754192 RepID=A0A1Y1XMT6_9FUNG|nr:translation initiation factor eIF3 subunit [Anaeromyces robustus]|eukprot:ORX86985.1 translation initiation factor eIF3 subunit [Anaeromyces robustus]